MKLQTEYFLDTLYNIHYTCIYIVHRTLYIVLVMCWWRSNLQKNLRRHQVQFPSLTIICKSHIGLTNAMRDQRPMMVATVDIYRYLHRFISYIVTLENYEVTLIKMQLLSIPKFKKIGHLNINTGTTLPLKLIKI